MTWDNTKALVFSLLAIASLYAQCASGEELHTYVSPSSGIIQCNGPAKSLWILNPAGRDIRIKAAELWMGMSERGVADYSAQIYAYDPDTNALRMLIFIGWDHYGEPTVPGNFIKSFGADWVTLKATQYLYIVGWCTGYPNVNGGIVGSITYTDVPVPVTGK